MADVITPLILAIWIAVAVPVFFIGRRLTQDDYFAYRDMPLYAAAWPAMLLFVLWIVSLFVFVSPFLAVAGLFQLLAKRLDREN